MRKQILIAVLFVLIFLVLVLATDEQRDPTAVQNETWVDPENASTYPTPESAYVGPAGDYYGNWTTFGFTIPAGSTIDSIVIPVRQHVGSTGKGHYINISVWNGSQWGVDHIASDTATTCNYEVINVTTDFTWTANQVNNIKVRTHGHVAGAGSGATRWVRLCHIPVNVSYSPPGGDNTRPNVTINDPNAGVNYSGNILINATVVDDVQVNSSGVFYWIENVSGNVTAWTNMSNVSSGNGSWYNATFVSTSVSDGIYNVTINASDNSSNENVSEKVEFTIDNTNPAVGYITPSQDEKKVGSFLINVSINDSTSGVQNVYYWIENVSGNVTAWTAMSLGAGDKNIGYWNATFDPSTLAYDKYNITTNTTDYTGNKNVTEKRQFIYTTPILNVTLITPLAGSSTNVTQNTTFWVNASVRCMNGACGTVVGSVRYNRTTANPDFLINYTDLNGIPFSNSTSQIPWSCGTLSQNQLCTLNWTVNATGTIGVSYYLDVNFTSSLSQTPDNDTSNFQINISKPSDQIPPSVTINDPNVGENHSENILINATVTDSDSGVNSSAVFYWIENVSGNVTAWTNLSNISSGNWQWYNATFDSTTISDGTYNVTINASDIAGNVNDSEKLEITIDNTNPKVGFITPLEGQNMTSSFLINVSINDTTSGVQNAYYWIENVSGNVTEWKAMSLGAGNINIGFWNATFNSGSLSDGLYNITINSTDYASNQNASVKVEIRIDNTPPAVTINDPDAGGNYSGNMLINATVTDSGSGVNSSAVYYWIENAGFGWTNLSNISSGDWQWYNATFDTTSISDGTYNVTINASDIAGNVNVTDKIEFTIDNNKPSVGFVAPGVNANISSSFLINASVNDSGTGVKEVFYWFENVSGNVTAWTAMSLGAGDKNIGYWNATASVASLSDGLYNITINATDYSNLQNATVKNQIRIDRSVPAVGIISPVNASNQSGNMLINASVNDTGSGVQNVYYWIENASGNVTAWTGLSLGSGTIYQGYWNATYDTTPLTNGSYNVTINATDYAGNQNASQKNWFNISVTADNIPPSVTINDPNSGGNYSGSILINATITDNILVNSSDVYYWLEQSGSNKTAWTNLSNISSGNWQWYNATFVSTSVSDGLYNVTINASDNSSNENVSEKVEITIDNNNPRVGFITPLEGQNKSGLMLINVSINDTTSGIQNAYYWLEQSGNNVTEWKAMSLGSGTINQGYWNATFNTSTLSDGLYNVTINATDYTGNQNVSVKVEIRIDNTEPYISINYPSEGQNLTVNQVWVNGTITDNNRNLNNPQINDSRFVLNSYTPGDGLFSFRNNSQIADGTVAVVVNFTDDAGNTNTSNARTFVFDNTRPRVGFITPLEGQNITGSFLINVSINDTTSGVQNAYYWLEQSGSNVTAWKAISLGSGTIYQGYWNATLNSGSLADGTYNITINATDYVDLQNASVKVQIVIDNTPPSVGYITPSQDEKKTSSFLINVSINDSASGVLNAYYWIENVSGNVTAWTAMSLGSGTIYQGYWNATYDPSGLAYGTYNITTNATDYTGNKNVTEKRQFIYTTPILNVTLIYPSGSVNVTQNNTFSVNASVRCLVGDCGTVVGSVRYNSSVAEPDINISVTPSGIPFWNMSGQIPYSCGTLNQNQLCTLNWTVNASGTIGVSYWMDVNFTSSLSQVPDNNTANFQINISKPSDQIPPSITINDPNPGENHSGSMLINATVTDGDTGVNSSEVYYWLEQSGSNVTEWTSMSNISSGNWQWYNATFMTTSMSDGAYNVTINASDVAGNQNATEKVEITIDNTAPRVGFISPQIDINISSNFLINVSINDSGTGVKEVFYWFENVSGNVTEWKSMSLGSGDKNIGYWNATVDISSISDSLYNITINATDYSNLQNATEKRQVRIDRNRPLVGIVSPSSGQNVSGNLLINASVNDSGSGVYLVYYWIENVSGNVTAWTQMIEGVSGYWNATFNTNSISDGLYNVTVNASDYAGNENVSEKVEFTIDNTLPYISITIPSEGQNLSGGNITVNGTVTDNNKVLNNPAISDSRFTLSSYNSGTGSFVFANNTQVEGSLSVVVNFTDDAGNTNTSNAKSFKIDNSVPAVGIVNPTANQEISGTIVINVSINDSISGVQNTYYWFENSSGGNQTEWKSMSLGSETIYQGFWNATFDTSLLPNGWYNITINVTDFSGNQNASVKVQVRIIRAAYVTNVDVFPDNPNANQDLNCSWNATSEGGSNLTANVTWWKDSTRVTTYDVENISCVNASLCYTNVTVDKSDTNPSEVWTCQVTVWNIWNATAAANGSETIRGRGGGGGQIPDTGMVLPPREVIKETHVFGWIKSIERKTFAIEKHKELKIKGLGISLKDSQTNVFVMLEKSIYDLETIIDVPKELGRGYSYVNITSDIPEKSLLSLTIDFNIEREWLEEKGLTPDKISLYRFGDGAWEELPTLYTTEDEEGLYFASLSSKFGTFVSMGGDGISVCDVTCPWGQAADPITCECVVIPPLCYITCGENQTLDEENCICTEEIPEEFQEARLDWMWSVLMALLIILAALFILFMILVIKKIAKDLGIKIEF